MSARQQTWTADAPSNIAVVKYMGKTDHGANVAVNPSLSMTLAAFRSQVALELLPEGATLDEWQPLSELPRAAGDRYLRFFARLKADAGIAHRFRIRSGNNFPSDCGLASSASSFAALTRASDLAFASLLDRPPRAALELARISRAGSGSSCRSFFAPWCAWEGDTIEAVASALPPLTDSVVVLARSAKKISSSEAHKRVATSPLMHGRAERARARQAEARAALAAGDFRKLAEVAWADSWEMHSMFHTSSPPFSYFCPETTALLRFVEDFWEKAGYGPLATIDAGPNVHLLTLPEEKAAILAALKRDFSPDVKILESGAGA